MDYYENVVIEYIRADRALFVNTECCIQVNEGDNPDTSGPHWYCDAVAVDFRNAEIFLCEISFAKHLPGLRDRLKGWSENWIDVCSALARDSHLPSDWPVRPWLFVPEELVPKLVAKVGKLLANDSAMPEPKITTLEMVQPWKYRYWNRMGEISKSEPIPVSMR